MKAEARQLVAVSSFPANDFIQVAAISESDSESAGQLKPGPSIESYSIALLLLLHNHDVTRTLFRVWITGSSLALLVA